MPKIIGRLKARALLNTIATLSDCHPTESEFSYPLQMEINFCFISKISKTPAV